MTSVPTAQSRTAWGLMRDRTFGPYVTGNVVSSCGNWIQQIAAAVLMFRLTRSAFMVGAVSMVLFAGPLLLALWTCVLSDRRDRRRVLMVGRGITCLAVGVLAVLINKDLEQALALASVAPSIARTVGPAGGAGLLLRWPGPGLRGRRRHARSVRAGHVLGAGSASAARGRPATNAWRHPVPAARSDRGHADGRHRPTARGASQRRRCGCHVGDGRHVRGRRRRAGRIPSRPSPAHRFVRVIVMNPARE